MMIKHKLEKNTVINKIVPDFMDSLYSLHIKKSSLYVTRTIAISRHL